MRQKKTNTLMTILSAATSLIAVRHRWSLETHGKSRKYQLNKARSGDPWRVLDELEFKCTVSDQPLQVVTQVYALPNHVLRVEFSDGHSGPYSMMPYLTEAPYDQLTPACFSQVRVSDGLVAWPGGIGIAPEMLLAAPAPAIPHY